MEHRRKAERTFDYFVLSALLVIFVTIIEAMTRQGAKPEVLTVLGSALGIDLGFIGLAAAHLWNTQKKQDGAEARKDLPPGTTVDKTTITSTTTTEPPAAPAAATAQEIKP